MDSSRRNDAQLQLYSPGGAKCALVGGHIAATLSNAIESSVYGGDAPYVKLLWPLVIFGHAHFDSRRALRAEYCIVGIPHNTAI